MSRFQTEAELCAELIAAATAQGWTAYPETAGWDLVLVRGDGAQLGIEAKLRGSLKLAAQLANQLKRPDGPRWIAAAVPERQLDFETVASALGANVLCPPWELKYLRLPMAALDFELVGRLDPSAPLHPFREPLSLPPAPPRVEAGARSPRRADRWKAAGLRVVARIEVRGTISAQELAEIFAGQVPVCWFGQGWLVRVGIGRGGALYELATGAELPPRRWPIEQPEAYAEALAIERQLAARAA